MIVPPPREPVRVSSFVRRDARLDAGLRDVADASGLGDAVALALGKLDEGSGTVTFGSYRGSVALYPASVVKLFYLACLEDHIARGELRATDELRRAEQDMIRQSTNDATALVLDTLTGTTGGPELASAALKAWMTKRAAVDRWLDARGFDGVIARQKPWNEGPYGREKQGYGPKNEWRNAATAESCLALMAGIALGKWHPPESRTRMLDLLNRRRQPTAGEEPDYQATTFLAARLPKSWGVWSKAGWTSEVRHDVALVRPPSGPRWVVVVMTKGHSGDETLVGRLGRSALQRLAPDLFL